MKKLLHKLDVERVLVLATCPSFLRPFHGRDDCKDEQHDRAHPQNETEYSTDDPTDVGNHRKNKRNQSGGDTNNCSKNLEIQVLSIMSIYGRVLALLDEKKDERW